jgi:hypothetical protein
VAVTPIISSNCRPLYVHVRVHYCLLFVQSIQEAGVCACSLTAIYRDCLVLASNAQWPEVQYLVSRGQIISVDPLLLTDIQTDGHRITIILYNDAMPFTK